ncbi:MAG: 50S ribosomal protein L10 [Candidatus Pacebacteria bacterium]|nr:50S ribosomal protein L10 [Candidatus Paceibacterota bacterium]
MDRSGKQALIDSLHQVFETAGLVVVTELKGLTVAEVTDLRRKMRAQAAELKVAKNRLAKRALVGTQYADLDSLFSGPTAIAYSADPVAAAKVAVTYAKTNDKVTIMGGSMGGQRLDAKAVTVLGNLPSLNELRGKLVGVLQAPAAQLARVTQAYADQGK